MAKENTHPPTEQRPMEDELILDNPPAPPIPGIEVGMRIGNFELKRQLGRGGMGEVWLAHQEAMGRDIALKLLSPVYISDENFVNRFLKEAKLSGRLEHPNIITAHDAGQDKGIYYLAMSFVDGDDLGNMLKKDHIIQEADALSYILPIAEALKYAWDNQKIIHRDIKPANIMVDSRGVPRLMDMGISKTLTEESSMTMTGAIVGTPYYISPEQAHGHKDMDFRADIYSLGATLYHIVVGDVPFNSNTTMGVLSKLITEPLPPPKVMNPRLSDGCAMLIEIMMAKNANERQPSWGAVIKDIKAVLEGDFPLTPLPADASDHYKDAKPSKKTAPAANKNIKIAIACSVLLISAALIGLFFAIQRSKHRKNKPPTPGNHTIDNSVPVPPPDSTTTTVVTPPDDTSSDSHQTTTQVPPPKHPDTTPDSTQNSKTDTGSDSQGNGDKTGKQDDPKTVVTPKPPEKSQEEKNQELWQFAMDYAKNSIKEENGYDLAVKQFEDIKKNLQGTTYAMKANIEIDRILKAKEKSVESLKDSLMKKATSQIKARKFDKAAEVFSDYNDRFADETNGFRTEMAEKCLKAPIDYRDLRSELPKIILQTKAGSPLITPMSVNTKLQSLKQFYPEEVAQLKGMLAGLRDCNQLVADSFKQTVGKPVDIAMNTGKTKNILVKQIVKDLICGETTTNGKPEKVSISLYELATTEYEKRLANVKPMPKALFLGYMNFNQRNYDQSEKLFEDAGPLSSELIKYTVKHKAVEREEMAEKDLCDIIEKAGFKSKPLAMIKILDQLREKLIEKPTAKTMLESLNAYDKTYKTTEFAEKHQEIIDILRKSAENSLKRKKILPDDKNDPLNSIIDATGQATDIFLLPGEKEKTKKDQKK